MGKQLHYYLNYSSSEQTFTYPYKAGTDLLTNNTVAASTKITLQPWDVAIIEEK
jgi:beta-galactosidase